MRPHQHRLHAAMMRSLIAGAAAAVLFVLSAPAHAAAIPPAGTRVRLTVLEGKASRRVIGTLQQADSTRLSVQPDRSEWLETFRPASVQQLEVSVGKHARPWEGLGLGLAAGAAIGAVLGYASGDDEEGWFALTAGEKAGLLGMTLGLAGAVAGLVVGATTKADTWRPYAEDPSSAQPAVGITEAGVLVGVTWKL